MKGAEILRLTFALLWLAQVAIWASKIHENAAMKDETSGKPQKP